MIPGDRLTPAVRDLVHAAILHALVFRRTPTLDRLATSTGLDVTVLDDALAALIASGAVVSKGSTILAAYPLSAVPTPHVVELAGATAWANCAVDALAVPAMVGGRGTIRSACSHCAKPITVQLGMATVLLSDPASVVVAYGGLSDGGGRPALQTRCPYINFFCREEHAQQWQSPASWLGRVLSLDQAVQLSVAHFRRVMEMYQHHRPGQRTDPQAAGC
jgi:hypothetical protein